MKLKNYVISLTTATDRREHITNEFGKQGIEFEFFDAVNYSQIDEVCDKFGVENLKYTENLAKGEKGCFLSHVSLWQKMLDEYIEWLAIFEDDVHLGEDAHLFLNHVDWLNSEIGLLKIEHFYPKLNLGHTASSHHHRDIQSLYSANLGTAGYIIHQNMAQQLLDLLKKINPDDIVAVDQFMFSQVIQQDKLKIFQLNPALCIQSDRLNPETHLHSDIHHERRNRMNIEKKNRTFIQKVKREFKRLFNQSKKTTYQMKNVEFK